MSEAGTVQPVQPKELASDFEQVAELVRVTRGERQPTICTTDMAGRIMSSQTFKNSLPPLCIVSQCAVLIERGGSLTTLIGYDADSGIFARGAAPDFLTLEQARTILESLLVDFRFATESDRSRALAALITPALVMGGLLHGRAPIDLGEADSSQTGKGYRNKLTAAIYGCVPQAVSIRRSGVGGLEESFDKALIAGHVFVSLDNIRGSIDSPAIESFCTEDTYFARAAFTPNTAIDPTRVILQFTSNKAEFTKDLANRSSCVRILKQRSDYQFSAFPEGDLLAHVRANADRYLGAVFAIVRAWHEAGQLRTNETRHDFREWAQTLDFIVQHLLHCAPLMNGHKETQTRMSNPAINWARDVALAVARQHRTGEVLIASDLLAVIEADGSIEIPNHDKDNRVAALQYIGRKMASAFSTTDGEWLAIDHLAIERETYKDLHNGNQRHRYRFHRDETQIPRNPAAA
jgi:hypothetical protein